MDFVSTKSGEIHRLDHPPYQIVGDVRPFRMDMVVFFRVQWDPSCIGYGKFRSKTSSGIIAECEPRFSQLDTALEHASRTIVSEMGRLAYSGNRIRQQGNSTEAKYIPKDIEGFTSQVKQAAKLYGAAIVGVARLDRRWVYSRPDGRLLNIPEDVNTVIVIGTEVDRELIRHSPSPLTSAATGSASSQMVFTVACLAEFLRELGWKAIGCDYETALSIPLAIDAGLGEFGRNGLLITPEFGARVRLCKIFTNAPLVPDKPIEFGVLDFCGKCGKCARACPAGAITTGERTPEALCASNNSGVLKWPVHAERCLDYWRTNGAWCSICISSCPLSQ